MNVVPLCDSNIHFYANYTPDKTGKGLLHNALDEIKNSLPSSSLLLLETGIVRWKSVEDSHAEL
jgi:hypothetical protein